MRHWLSKTLNYVGVTSSRLAVAIAPSSPPQRSVTPSQIRPSQQTMSTQAVPETPITPTDVSDDNSPDIPSNLTTDFDIYHQYPPHVLYTFRDKQAIFNDALKSYTAVPVEDEASGLYSDPIRVLNFFQLIEQANCLPAGDYLELGSHRGFSTRVIHRFMDPSQTLFAFDTFEGFDKRDTDVEKGKYDSSWQEGGFGLTSTQRVAHYVGDSVWPANLKLVQGWFPQSFAGHETLRWRFVHIDFDLYQPIKSALETIWEPLLPGGVVVVHDYGCYGFPGARMAVDEFCRSVGVPPIELSDRWSSAAFRKPFATASR